MLEIEEFGRDLIRTQDLDPVYSGIVGANLPEPQLCRLLLAYWCFYHLGVAARLSDLNEDFWLCTFVVADNRETQRYPRGTERRHFRGEKCVRAIGKLQELFPEPEAAVRSLYSCVDEEQTMKRVQEWPLFGPWIAFKAADMMERVLGRPLKFRQDIGLVYKEPKAGLDLLTSERGRDQGYHYQALLARFQSTPAPPRMDRYCGPQEIETVLCKWKSYRGGHYWIGKDIKEVRHALKGWGPTADAILNSMPPEVQLEAETLPHVRGQAS